jgi:DNA-binding NarL/FixJ family response regulator
VTNANIPGARLGCGDRRMTIGNGVASRIAPQPALWDDDDMPLRVLIVDDHAGFRAIARMLLQTEGFEVVGEAANGEEGLAHAYRVDADVALIDVQLPDMDGFAVAHQLTSDGIATQVVLTSSRDASDLGSLVKSCGARGFIPKAELSAARIRELLL